LRFFLTAKHWQVFLLLFGAMVAGQLTLMALILSAEPIRDVTALRAVTLPFFAVTYATAVLLLAWLWTLGEYCAARVPAELKPRIVRFRSTLLYPLAYLPVFVWAFPTLVDNPSLALVIVPLHLLAMFCTIYNFYFVAKTLALAERQKPVSFSDFALEFFFLWFFPLGIWLVQPRINRLAAR